MVYYEVCNLYQEHYNKYELIGRLKTSGFTYFGILHDKDIFPTGEPKKPHFHLILGVIGDSRHTKAKVVSFFNNDSNLYIKNVKNPKGYCRYLTHKDNLEKTQYKDTDVFTNDYNLYEELTQKQIISSNTDLLLEQFKSYILSVDFTSVNIYLLAFHWFNKMGKLDYYMKNETRIQSFIHLLIDYEIEKENIENATKRKRN